MPVLFQIKGLVSSPSNKGVEEGNGGKKNSDVAYTYKPVGGDTVYVLRPFVDRISITVPIADQDQCGAVIDSVKAFALEKNNPMFTKTSWKGKYKARVSIVEPETGHRIRVFAGPTEKGTSHCYRLEFNPNKLGPERLEWFKAKIAKLTMGAINWMDVVAGGRATEIDVTTDLVHAPMAELLYESHLTGKGHIYVGLDGELETAYLALPGPQKSSDQKLYNKSQEQLDKDHPLTYGNKATSRVEMTYKASTLALKKIGNIKNPFKRVTVMHHPQCPTGWDKDVWGLFLDSAQLRGAANAIARLSPDKGAAAKEALDDAAAMTWRADKLWTLWPMAVEKSGLLDLSNKETWVHPWGVPNPVL